MTQRAKMKDIFLVEFSLDCFALVMASTGDIETRISFYEIIQDFKLCFHMNMGKNREPLKV